MQFHVRLAGRYVRAPRALAMAVLLVGWSASPARAQFSGPPPSNFTLIADTSTPIPGGTGNFAKLQTDPCINAGNVAFIGNGSGGQTGVYVKAPADPCVPIADIHSKVPGSTDNLVSFPGDPCLSGPNAAFYATGTGGQQGIYASLGGTLTRIADTTTPVPKGGGGFVFNNSAPPNPCISGSTVVFGGGNAVNAGVYSVTSNAITIIADKDTPIPAGTGNFDFSSHPSDPCISGNNIVFVGAGSGGQQGVYRQLNGGSITRIADTNTPIPHGTGNFVSVPPCPVISGGNIAFLGNGSGSQQGVYAFINNHLLAVADTTTPIPGGTGDFTNYPADPIFPGAPIVPANLSIDGNNVAFLAQGAGGQEGIYVDLAIDPLAPPNPIKIVDLTDSIEGKTIQSLGLGREGLDGNEVVFSAFFTDGSSGVFTSPLPEPAALGLLCVAGLLLTRRPARAEAHPTDFNK